MRCRSGEGHDAGSVSAELAVAFPAVVLLLGVVLGVGATVLGQVRCVDAARAGARWAARGEAGTDVRRRVVVVSPDATSIGITGNGALVTVRVTCRSARVPGPVAWVLPAPRATATAWREAAIP